MSEPIYDSRGRIQEPRWYALAVTTQHEKSVRKRIQSLAQMDRWKDQIFEAIIPATIEIDAKGKEKERMIYTQYVYVHMILNDDTWHALDAIDGFRAVLPPETEKPLTDDEVLGVFKMIGREEEYKARMKQDRKNDPSANFEEGEVVTIHMPDEIVFHEREAKVVQFNPDKGEATLVVEDLETKLTTEIKNIKKRS